MIKTVARNSKDARLSAAMSMRMELELVENVVDCR